MKKIDYAKKTHLSYFLFVCRVGTPLHLVHRRTKKFPFQLQPKRRGAKGGLHFLIVFQLAVGSVDLSQAEKDIAVCKADRIHKKTSIFAQNDNFPGFLIFKICSTLQTVISSFAWR